MKLKSDMKTLDIISRKGISLYLDLYMYFLEKNVYFCKSIVQNIYPKRNQSSFIIVYHLFLKIAFIKLP